MKTESELGTNVQGEGRTENSIDGATRVFMVCPNPDDSAEVAAMLKRVSAALSAVDSFADKMVELDEDDPRLESQVSPLLNRLLLTLMAIYPNARQMGADVKSIGDFTVRTINI